MKPPIFRPDLKAEPWLSLAQTIRARDMIVTPYRLGLQAGRQGLELRCPYHLPRSIDGFRQGVTWGRMERRREEKAARDAQICANTTDRLIK